ncbi:diaminopimelate decarboxylase family protein [Kitasatospora sp. NPDC004289]
MSIARPTAHPTVWVPDEAGLRDRCRSYRSAFPDADVVHVAPPYLCGPVVRWVREEGLGLEVRSTRELDLAVAAGLPPGRILLHGGAGSPEALRAAVELGVGRIVLDSASESARLAALVAPGTRQQVLLSVLPGVGAGGRTLAGPAGPRPGLCVTDGSAQHAIARLVRRPELELVGLSCQVGAQPGTLKPYLAAVRRMVGLMARTREQHGIQLRQLDLGGETGADGPVDLAPPVLSALAHRLRAELAHGCAQAGLAVPRLTLEPGREVTGPAGATDDRSFRTTADPMG